jgi:hypothetical protein
MKNFCFLHCIFALCFLLFAFPVPCPLPPFFYSIQHRESNDQEKIFYLFSYNDLAIVAPPLKSRIFRPKRTASPY